MKTAVVRLFKKNRKEVIVKAARLIRSGKLVVFPTETVYGLGANVFDTEALRKIFKAKGRPSDNPVIVHIARLEQLKDLAVSVSSLEQKMIDAFWPGPLTIIFKKKKNISNIVSGGLSTIAVRMPSHPFARHLILSAGVPMAAPSANLSGRPSGTTSQHIYEDLVGRVPLIIDAGPSQIGLESTVVKVEKEKIFILRPGVVTKEMLERAITIRVVFSKNAKRNSSSPGAKYRHYAPRARVEILKDASVLTKRLAVLKKQKKKVGILKRGNLGDTAKNLYNALRTLDARGVDVILSQSFPKKGLGVAVMDRLGRAAKK